MNIKPENVDADEIEKFSQLAAKWWDASGEFKTLHDINPLRLSYIQEWTSVSGQKILDVGCGGGILTEALAHAGADVGGIDLAEKSLAVARRHAEETSLAIGYECIAVEAMAEAHPETYDVVVCMEMLEHVPDPQSVITACTRLLKPNGFLFLSTLNRNLKSYLGAIVAAEYLLSWLPRGTHDHNKFITPAEMARMCRHAELSVLDVRGLSYRILTRDYALTDDTAINYFMVCKK